MLKKLLSMLRPSQAMDAEIFPTKDHSEHWLKLDADLAAARAEAIKLSALNDAYFVAEIRQLERDRPDWVNLINWHSFVARELELRTLLQGAKNTGEPVKRSAQEDFKNGL